MLERNIRPRTEAEYQRAIERDFPDLVVTSVEVLASGWDRVAVLVNNSIVFRMPAEIDGDPSPRDVQATQKEMSLLSAVKGLPINIPRPSHVSPDVRYFGYDFLEGRRWKDHPSMSTPTDAFLRSWVRARQAIAKAL